MKSWSIKKMSSDFNKVKLIVLPNGKKIRMGFYDGVIKFAPSGDPWRFTGDTDLARYMAGNGYTFKDGEYQIVIYVQLGINLYLAGLEEKPADVDNYIGVFTRGYSGQEDVELFLNTLYNESYRKELTRGNGYYCGAEPKIILPFRELTPSYEIEPYEGSYPYQEPLIMPSEYQYPRHIISDYQSYGINIQGTMYYNGTSVLNHFQVDLSVDSVFDSAIDPTKQFAYLIPKVGKHFDIFTLPYNTGGYQESFLMQRYFIDLERIV